MRPVGLAFSLSTSLLLSVAPAIHAQAAPAEKPAALIVTGVDAIPTEGNPAMQYILNPKLSWPIALICVGILISVGLLAGVLPARRAAAVDPVESLRYE